MDGHRLLAWGDLDERRRHERSAARRMAVLGVGLLLAGEAARRGGWFHGELGAPSAAFVVAIVMAGLLPAMLSAPHRMFWRRDAPLLARLPIPGTALWRTTVVRSLRSVATAGVAVLPTLLVVAVSAPGMALRVAALTAVLGLATVALVPATGLCAAHLVSSGKAQDLAAAVGGGEVPVTSTTLLGALPGAVIAGVVLAAIYAVPWIEDGADPTGPIVLLVVAVGSVAALGGATAAAPRVFPQAMREVAGLDRQIYAHLEIEPITPIERRVKARLSPAAAPIYDRMARLLRRRYPLVVFSGFVVAVVYVAVGAARPDELAAWLAVTAIAQGLIAAWLARALSREPLELTRLTTTLPVVNPAVVAARRAYVAGWCVVWGAVPAVIAIVLCGRPLIAGLVIAAGFSGAGVIGRRL